MTDSDPRLKQLEIKLRDSIEKSKTRSAHTNIALELWPSSHTLNKTLEDPSNYKEPITQPRLMTQEEFLDSLREINVPQEIIVQIKLVTIDYRGFDNQIYHGQIIIHKDLVSSIQKIFKRILLETDFPMTSVFPISMFNWTTSSKLDNCGAFDWRFVADSDEISDHAFGAAIDINSELNPYVRKGLPNHPRDLSQKGTLLPDSKVVKIFKEEGWKWGGDWEKSKDWMHFYRPEIAYKYYGKIEVKE